MFSCTISASKYISCLTSRRPALSATVRHCQQSPRNRRELFPAFRAVPYARGQGSRSAPAKSSDHARLPAPVVSLEAASVTMTALVSRPIFLLAAAIGFSVIAFDVTNPASLHFLPQNIDQPAHAWVKANLPVPIKNLVAEKLVSDLFITGGIAGWVLAGAAGISKSRWTGAKRLAIALFMYVFGGGSIQHGDPFIVNQLKTHFQRLRPSDILNTYAFPSGHTTAAVFIMGTLLCVLLPPLTINSDNTRSSKLQTVVTSAALPVWALAAVTTATGRVLGDAHWISDTMAGACLGAGLVSVTTILCSKLAADVKQ